MRHNVLHLPKQQWQNHPLPTEYRTEEYYNVRVDTLPAGFAVTMERQKFDTPAKHGFQGKLYAEHWPDACAWGILIEGKLAAAIETCPEAWSNRLRVTELWVDADHQRQGLGHALMKVAKEQAGLERKRAVILETQSCNVGAIDFYLHEGFSLVGIDTCCYSNCDIARNEVRIELGWFPQRRARLSRQEVEIREERPEDWHEVERMLQRAFWNKFQPGCDDHYLVHKLRDIEEYLPQLSRIALKNGEVIGAIFYSRAFVQDGDKRHDILTFGPLGISPEWRGCGVGEILLHETMTLAADAGYPGIVILGEPDYYPRVGFKTCDHFSITTRDEKNFDALMGRELVPGGMKDLRGKFNQALILYGLPPEEAEEYSRKFPPLEKRYFPMQWNTPPPS